MDWWNEMGKCIRVAFNNEYDSIREEIQYFMGLNYAASLYTIPLRSLISLIGTVVSSS